MAHKFWFASAFLLVSSMAFGFDHSHGVFTAVLQQHVSDDGVNYGAMVAEPAALNQYLGELAAVTQPQFTAFSREQQLAFLINTYNAFVIKIIVDHYPISRRGFKGLLYPSSSIWQIPGVWKKIKRPAGGRELALDDIEHVILRPQFAEPRIHFALVCAAVSCPDLRKEAYTAGRLDQQLDEQTKSFLGNAAKGLRVDPRRQTIYLSSIFKWFGEDFVLLPAHDGEYAGGRATAGVMHFVQPRVSAERQAAVTDSDYRVRYIDYDWTLNDASP